MKCKGLGESASVRCGRRGGTRKYHAYRICETFADFSLERVKASVTKHDECDFLMLVCPVSSTGGVPLAMVSSTLGHWTRGIYSILYVSLQVSSYEIIVSIFIIVIAYYGKYNKGTRSLIYCFVFS